MAGKYDLMANLAATTGHSNCFHCGYGHLGLPSCSVTIEK